MRRLILNMQESYRFFCAGMFGVRFLPGRQHASYQAYAERITAISHYLPICGTPRHASCDLGLRPEVDVTRTQ
jgi:hypothetical protein